MRVANWDGRLQRKRRAGRTPRVDTAETRLVRRCGNSSLAARPGRWGRSPLPSFSRLLPRVPPVLPQPANSAPHSADSTSRRNAGSGYRAGLAAGSVWRAASGIGPAALSICWTTGPDLPRRVRQALGAWVAAVQSRRPLRGPRTPSGRFRFARGQVATPARAVPGPTCTSELRHGEVGLNPRARPLRGGRGPVIEDCGDARVGAVHGRRPLGPRRWNAESMGGPSHRLFDSVSSPVRLAVQARDSDGQELLRAGLHRVEAWLDGNRSTGEFDSLSGSRRRVKVVFDRTHGRRARRRRAYALYAEGLRQGRLAGEPADGSLRAHALRVRAKTRRECRHAGRTLSGCRRRPGRRLGPGPPPAGDALFLGARRPQAGHRTTTRGTGADRGRARLGGADVTPRSHLLHWSAPGRAAPSSAGPSPAENRDRLRGRAHRRGPEASSSRSSWASRS
jgi:hypothetical protein